ncbi:prolyl oligopeptidase family protein [Actinomycetospora succinea]|uniref:Prolyl oligopeptidase family protein n=1 Tax=Actinomycetospora succinea TaxID=663603 RepID=A0A4R6VAH3_9PSEU|nr:alpha/beta fold hydrolase [Actinomycetospora succinea]TDQ58876.1 prolyl oligopeptidase family protein [Actinomycetospora succinea]
MFEVFPGNYVWNLSVNIALNTGAHISEVDEACAPVLDAARDGEDAGTELFFRSWTAVADRLAELAREDEAAGHPLSAGARYYRAAVHYLTAERLQSRHYAPRQDAYRAMLDAFGKALALDRHDTTRVEIPYGDTSLPALFVAARGVDGPAPCMVFTNGLDSTKEMVHGSGIAQELARRGVSSLIVDHPGSGEALRLRGLTGRHDSEHWAGPCVDWLETRDDVDGERVGVIGWSLGGYYAPRAAAFEERFRICVAWGANYDWGELQKRRLAREGDRPVPHYWDHVQWVFGKDTLDEFMAFAPSMSLVGVTERITVPFLVTHGANDRQIPREYAIAQYETAVNSPRRELKWFTAREGGVEHVSADNMPAATGFIADWIHDTL